MRTMRVAGLIVAQALAEVRDVIRPGLSLVQINELADTVIRDNNATPSFFGYEGFPASVCISVNEQVIHGIPTERKLRDGDVVSIDCGAHVDGWHADSAATFLVGEPLQPHTHDLIEVTRSAMWSGIAAMDSARYVRDIGGAIESTIEQANELHKVEFGIVEDYVGHGIGSALHQAPDVVNFWVREKGPRLKPGLCLAIEPMVTLGSAECDVLDDSWTVVTRDGSLSAHWEHTVALLDDGICVLTAQDGGKAELADYGIVVSEP